MALGRPKREWGLRKVIQGLAAFALVAFLATVFVLEFWRAELKQMDTGKRHHGRHPSKHHTGRTPHPHYKKDGDGDHVPLPDHKKLSLQHEGGLKKERRHGPDREHGRPSRQGSQSRNGHGEGHQEEHPHGQHRGSRGTGTERKEHRGKHREEHGGQRHRVDSEEEHGGQRHRVDSEEENGGQRHRVNSEEGHGGQRHRVNSEEEHGGQKHRANSEEEHGGQRHRRDEHGGQKPGASSKGPVRVVDHEVRRNPGGTEAEALEERQRLGNLNWPLGDIKEAAWDFRERPKIPESLASVQGSNASLATHFRTALKACRGSWKEDGGPPHEDLDLHCLSREYYERFFTPGPADCDATYSHPAIETFRTNKLEMCTTEEEGEWESRVVCHTQRIPGHSKDTSHCQANRVQINYDRMPHGGFPWLDFKKGALTAKCSVTEEGRARWKGMFMQCIADWFEKGFDATSEPLGCDEVVESPTYFMTRSGDYSPFHLAHDLVNAFHAVAIFEMKIKDMQVVIMDRMTKGFYLPLWQWLFSPRHKLQWYPDLARTYRGKKVCYKNAVFNVPARLSLLYNNHEKCLSTPSSTLRLVSDFVLFSLHSLTVSPVPDAVVVTLIVRRNYKTGHAIGRRFGNLDELIAGLRGLDPAVVVNAVNYADYDFDQQIHISRSTDLLVAMHGAGLIQMMFLPPTGAVFEFFCPEKPPSNYRYRHLAHYLGLDYDFFSLGNAENRVSVPAVRPKLVSLVRRLKARKGME